MVQWVKGLVLLQWRGCYCGVGSIPGSGTPACCELKKKKKKKKKKNVGVIETSIPIPEKGVT